MIILKLKISNYQTLIKAYIKKYEFLACLKKVKQKKIHVLCIQDYAMQTKIKILGKIFVAAIKKMLVIQFSNMEIV